MPASLKPFALQPGAEVGVVSLSSPVEQDALRRGMEELMRLGFRPRAAENATARQGYFAGPHRQRLLDFASTLKDESCAAVFCSRGGFGSTYLLDELDASNLPRPKIVQGFSDATAVQTFLWQKLRWVTFYGPMVAAGFDKGPAGYDADSFRNATSNTSAGWRVSLGGEPLREGVVEGVLLGGCLTMLEATLGTPWELDTANSILILEDRGMKPFQVERSLAHLRQAGKLAGGRGIILGEFPECEAPAGSEDVCSVAQRVLGDLAGPVVWGAAVGHTPRPMLTLPLGVRARLECRAGGRSPVADLTILEPAVV